MELQLQLCIGIHWNSFRFKYTTEKSGNNTILMKSCLWYQNLWHDTSASLRFSGGFNFIEENYYAQFIIHWGTIGEAICFP